MATVRKLGAGNFGITGGMRRSGGAGVLSGDGITCKIPAKGLSCSHVSSSASESFATSTSIPEPSRSLDSDSVATGQGSPQEINI